jgi:hypothetical protein
LQKAAVVTQLANRLQPPPTSGSDGAGSGNPEPVSLHVPGIGENLVHLSYHASVGGVNAVDVARVHAFRSGWLSGCKKMYGNSSAHGGGSTDTASAGSFSSSRSDAKQNISQRHNLFCSV